MSQSTYRDRYNELDGNSGKNCYRSLSVVIGSEDARILQGTLRWEERKKSVPTVVGNHSSIYLWITSYLLLK